MYEEDDLVPISALQHLLFCERQCAFIHVEQAWRENQFTAEGRIMHERAHGKRSESRPGVRTEFGMPIRSMSLGITGMADVVEFRAGSNEGARDSLYPVEYKRGRRKARMMDEVQLCAQALCLEEMLGVAIPEGALFYGKERRRKVVAFDETLRAVTRSTAGRVHELIDRGITPAPLYTEMCKRCSFIESCMPLLFSKRQDVGRYIARMAAVEPSAEEEEP
ncbi:MAG TPA: CRISPR-associated protein Cas4 [Spirochaetia bacterium]|nr:CRISPR-associated protein Cas4 [Spirochaetia bacterium]